jgi:glutamate synthase domain-containing protein 1
LMYWETPRDIASCGILGILRRDGASKIKADETLTSIECVRYREAGMGPASLHTTWMQEAIIK